MTKKTEVVYEYDGDGNIVIDGYHVHELSLGDMREIQRNGVEKEDIQYVMAAKCVVKPDGSNITEQELLKLGVRRGTRLLQAVAFMNTAPGDEEGNA